MDLSQLPDFRGGMEIRDILDGTIVAGRVDAEEAILMRRGEEFFAVGGQCTHNHGALARGLAVGDTIRCPLHHVCFSLRSGLAAADRLRREGYAGRITMISADSAAPYDRPNLSKDFLMGTAPAEWMPLRSADDYSERKIELLLNSRD